ncbi:MAG: inorganic phosphate transporter [Gammaproteobacteria bacterium GWE2_37_16]|nr:MAG: inorganic phosphate transporter [Gammaproteobacteria bacterium GWE2_37_16]
MHELTLIALILVIIISLLFDYINGFHDTANAIATCISTRALSIRYAVALAAIFNLIGALTSTKVAATIGTGIVDAHNITQMVILIGVLSAVIWGIVTWYFAIPSSSSHALIGGLIGSTIAHAGFTSLHWFGLKKIILALLLSPILGIVAGFILIVVLLWAVRCSTPNKINKKFRKLQILSAAFMAFSHGTADAQKSMGIITLALLNYGYLKTFSVPLLVALCCAIAIALGTAIGGWKIIKTVGKKFVKLQPIDGFCAQIASAGVIIGASAFGLPTSTTHVVTSSILGIGLSKRLSAINWKIAMNILWASVFTIPVTGMIAFVLFAILQTFWTAIPHLGS